MTENKKINLRLPRKFKPYLRFAPVAVLLLTGVLTIIAGVYLSRRNQDLRSSAAAGIACHPSSFCAMESECYAVNGIAGAACGPSQICCQLQPPEVLTSTMNTTQSGGKAVNNCCGTEGYPSCESRLEAERTAAWEDGYYDWIGGVCPAAKLKAYNGQMAQIPGTIQAEDYDEGGAGVAYSDSDRWNNGRAYRPDEQVDIKKNSYDSGHTLGWVRSGEWVTYSVNVAQSGTYTLDARVATTNRGGPKFDVFVGRNKVATVTVPNTGSWDKMTTVTVSDVNLQAGEQTLKVQFLDNSQDIDYLKFSLQQTSGGSSGTGGGNETGGTGGSNVPPTGAISSPGNFKGISSGAVAPDEVTVEYVSDPAKTSKVDFYVDGKYIRTERGAPYTLGGDNNGVINPYSLTSLADGRHELQARVYLTNGSVQDNTLVFFRGAVPAPTSTPKPPTPSPQVDQGQFGGIADGQTVSGKIYVQLLADKNTTRRVTFYVDDKQVNTESTAPYYLGGNSGSDINGYSVDELSAGNHVLKAVLEAVDGKSYEKTITFKTGNSTGDADTGSSFVGVKNGDTISGRLAIEYLADPQTTRRVEFFIDGSKVGTENYHQYFLGGNIGPVGYGYNFSQYAGKEIKLMARVTGKDGSVREEMIRLKVQ